MKKITRNKQFFYSHGYFARQAVSLTSVLLENGIDDAGKIEEIVGSYLFAMAVDLDQYYLLDKKISPEKVYPTLVFRNKASPTESDVWHLPNDEDEMHGGLQSELPEALVKGVDEDDGIVPIFDVVFDNGMNGDVNLTSFLNIKKKSPKGKGKRPKKNKPRK